MTDSMTPGSIAAGLTRHDRDIIARARELAALRTTADVCKSFRGGVTTRHPLTPRHSAPPGGSSESWP